MSAPEDLKATYSFIDTLESESVLEPYGNNALPLFAVGLHLGIEDLENFATESLTDSPNDKKADIIYINEAEEVACIAQGTTAVNWGKAEAHANKASDLNTAAVWLLLQPIDDVPEQIREHAKLLRDGLSKGTITRLTFAYAHNAFESANVERELKATRQLLGDLEISQQCEIEVVELGLRTIEALHLASQGSIQVVDEIKFPASQCIKETSHGWEAFVISINGGKLFDLYKEHQNALFSANLRDFLGARKTNRNVHNTIRKTVDMESDLFYIFNNGITIVCKKAVYEDEILKVHGISVVNGAQTTGAIHAAGREHADNISVLARIIVVGDQTMIPRIVAANNTQNAIVASDRRSNDAVQVRLAQEFRSKGITYVHRRDSTRKTAKSIFADSVGQMLCAFGGNLQTAIRAKADIFEVEAIYNHVFPSTLAVGHVFGVQTLGWAYDSIKQGLKQKASNGSLTEIQQRQLTLLDYPASKQFLITVMGALREEIAGKPIPGPKEFMLKDEAITPEGMQVIAAWMKTINAVLPILVEELPSEEYQVVRSNEHTKAVVRRARGIVAGASMLWPNFDDLRAFLSTM